MDDETGAATIDLFLGMAHLTRLGQWGQAESLLRPMLDRLQSTSPQAGTKDPGRVNMNHWLILRAAAREARQLINA
jgi:hypothetical protein